MASVYNASHHFVRSLLNTFYNDNIIHLFHLDRIKAYQVQNGIWNAFVFDGLCYLEILQFIIHKIDYIFILSGIQILQRSREWHIIILSGNALGRYTHTYHQH